jgi:hypothetical protein
VGGSTTVATLQRCGCWGWWLLQGQGSHLCLATSSHANMVSLVNPCPTHPSLVPHVLPFPGRPWRPLSFPCACCPPTTTEPPTSSRPRCSPCPWPCSQARASSCRGSCFGSPGPTARISRETRTCPGPRAVNALSVVPSLCVCGALTYDVMCVCVCSASRSAPRATDVFRGGEVR